MYSMQTTNDYGYNAFGGVSMYTAMPYNEVSTYEQTTQQQNQKQNSAEQTGNQ
jgi:hypothetical protein